jgi:hypothetical protein
MKTIWKWLSGARNQKTLAFIGAALVGAVGLWKAVFGSPAGVAAQDTKCTLQLHSTGSTYGSSEKIVGGLGLGELTK